MYSEGNNVTDAKIYSDINFVNGFFGNLLAVCTQILITQTHKSTKSISAIIRVIQCFINRYIGLFNQKHI